MPRGTVAPLEDNKGDNKRSSSDLHDKNSRASIDSTAGGIQRGSLDRGGRRSSGISEDDSWHGGNLPNVAPGLNPKEDIGLITLVERLTGARAPRCHKNSALN